MRAAAASDLLTAGVLALAKWSFAPAPGLLVGVAGACYFIGVQRLRERGRAWPVRRSVSFGAGLFALVLATQGFVAVRDDQFDTHVVQHLLLGMAAPFLIALGAPVTLALQAASRSTQTRVLRILHCRLARILSHPLVVGCLFSFTLFALYFSPLYGLSVRNVFVHAGVHAHFFIVGSLFFWTTVGLDPAAWRLPYGARLALVLLMVPLHAFLGLALLSTTHPLDAESVGSLAQIIDTQHRGAAIMWAVGDLIGLAAGGVVLAQWMRHEERRGARIDREFDAAADAPSPTGHGPMASAAR